MAIDVSPYHRQLVKECFPDLVEGVSFEFTSPVDYNYNCLSWALSNNHDLLQEVCGGFWPWHHLDDDTVEGWTGVCQIHGFTPLDDLNTSLVPGYEKIAILENTAGELHATRSDRNGIWKSKLGDGPDIDHDGLDGLAGTYGKVVRVLQKRRLDWI